MKYLSILTLVFFFSITAAYAAPIINIPNGLEENSVDAAINDLVQQVSRLCNLENDQQMMVKKAAKQLAADAASQKPLDAKKSAALKNAFTTSLSKNLNSEQLAQFNSVLSTNINPLLDAVINAVK